MITPSEHRLNVNVLLSNITVFVIFAVLDVSLAVNLCINCSFFYIYICSFIKFLSYYSKIAFLDCLHKSFVLTVWWTKLATRQLFTAR